MKREYALHKLPLSLLWRDARTPLALGQGDKLPHNPEPLGLRQGLPFQAALRFLFRCRSPNAVKPVLDSAPSHLISSPQNRQLRLKKRKKRKKNTPGAIDLPDQLLLRTDSNKNQCIAARAVPYLCTQAHAIQGSNELLELHFGLLSIYPPRAPRNQPHGHHGGGGGFAYLNH